MIGSRLDNFSCEGYKADFPYHIKYNNQKDTEGFWFVYNNEVWGIHSGTISKRFSEEGYRVTDLASSTDPKLKELYYKGREIIAFQLYGNYLTGSTGEFIKITGVDTKGNTSVKSRLVNITQSLTNQEIPKDLDSPLTTQEEEQVALLSPEGLKEEKQKAIAASDFEKYIADHNLNQAQTTYLKQLLKKELIEIRC